MGKTYLKLTAKMAWELLENGDVIMPTAEFEKDLGGEKLQMKRDAILSSLPFKVQCANEIYEHMYEHGFETVVEVGPEYPLMGKLLGYYGIHYIGIEKHLRYELKDTTTEKYIMGDFKKICKGYEGMFIYSNYCLGTRNIPFEEVNVTRGWCHSSTIIFKDFIGFGLPKITLKPGVYPYTNINHVEEMYRLSQMYMELKSMSNTEKICEEIIKTMEYIKANDQ